MANELIPQYFYDAKVELEDIMAAGAKGLKEPGMRLMPVKREMLNLPDAYTDLILDACQLLFSAILNYEGAHWNIKTATDPITLISARIDAGRAEAVVNSLFFGPTAKLLLCAMDRAPIAFYAMSKAAPDLQIIDRCDKLLNKRF